MVGGLRPEPLGDLLGRFDECLARVDDRDEIERLMRGLTARERHVLHAIAHDGLTLDEAGGRLGISQSRVSTLRAGAIDHMRRAAGMECS